jgi:hypothetical protein
MGLIHFMQQHTRQTSIPTAKSQIYARTGPRSSSLISKPEECGMQRYLCQKRSVSLGVLVVAMQEQLQEKDKRERERERERGIRGPRSLHGLWK